MAYLADSGLAIVHQFSLMDWVYIFILGSLGSLGKILKFKALQYEEPGKLGGISYVQNIIQFLMDVLILHIAFNGL